MRTSEGLVHRIADKICSPYNQNATMIFVGGTGSGKSLAAISLALEVSKIVAEKKGGEPEDYFNLETNMSVIDVNGFFGVLKQAKQYSTVIFDDAGIGWNARKFQDVVNITLNNITQTFRTLNLFSILTTPNFFFIDKVGRTLTEWYCEMEGVFKSPYMRGKNISRGKVFEIQTHSRLGSHGKIFYVSPRADNGHGKEKNFLCTFNKPPDDICVIYEKLRREGAEEYARKSIEEINAKKGDKEDNGSDSDLNKVCECIERELIEAKEQGIKTSIFKKCKEHSISRGKFYDWRGDQEYI